MSETNSRHQSAQHFELHHEDNGEAIVCMSHDNECSVLAQIAAEYSDVEEEFLATSVEQALSAIDNYMEGRASEVFQGLHIVLGEDLTSGGAEALPAENRVLLNGRKLSMSIADMRNTLDSYSDDELTGGSIDEHDPSGALQYTLVHEMGHILDERTLTGESRHRVDAGESPTAYGRVPDEWHDEKDHEAFAEGFAHLVFGIPVSSVLETAVAETIESRLDEVDAAKTQ
ncbi:MAG: hypothetical protein WD467_03495 [Candidatus Saccharimonadales bacterium]